jgi:hypothetical protein
MRTRWPVAVLLVVACTVSGAAQDPPETQTEKPATAAPPEKPPAAKPQGTGAIVPLKVTVVLSRYRADKKISSLPYILGVAANGPRTTLRMGSDVPVAQTVFGGSPAPVGGSPASVGGSPASVPQTSFSYRKVGTNIDCDAATATAGLFRLQVTVSNTSVHLESPEKAATGAGRVADAPLIRTFNSSFTILLRDGQTLARLGEDRLRAHEGGRHHHVIGACLLPFPLTPSE